MFTNIPTNTVKYIKVTIKISEHLFLTVDDLTLLASFSALNFFLSNWVIFERAKRNERKAKRTSKSWTIVVVAAATIVVFFWVLLLLLILSLETWESRQLRTLYVQKFTLNSHLQLFSILLLMAMVSVCKSSRSIQLSVWWLSHAR